MFYQHISHDPRYLGYAPKKAAVIPAEKVKAILIFNCRDDLKLMQCQCLFALCVSGGRRSDEMRNVYMDDVRVTITLALNIDEIVRYRYIFILFATLSELYMIFLIFFQKLSRVALDDQDASRA